MELLNTQQQSLLTEERNLLNDLRVALVKFGATVEDQETLEKSIAQLDDFFLLVIVGEFNAGKSAFINALLGQPILKEGWVNELAQRFHVDAPLSDTVVDCASCCWRYLCGGMCPVLRVADDTEAKRRSAENWCAMRKTFAELLLKDIATTKLAEAGASATGGE